MRKTKELKFNIFYSNENEFENIIIDYLKEFIKNMKN